MVAIIENARFNRNSLLGDLADLIRDFPYPGDNYPKAVKIVWHAMRNEAIRQNHPHMVGDDDRPGYQLIGMGPSQALDLLWNTLPVKTKARVRQRIAVALRESNNAKCIEQGRNGSLAQWWVADQWEELKMARPELSRERKSRKPQPDYVGQKSDKAAQQWLSQWDENGSAVEPAAPELSAPERLGTNEPDETWAEGEPAAPVKASPKVDAWPVMFEREPHAALEQTFANLRLQITELCDENIRLRAELDKYTKLRAALKGLSLD